MNELTLSHHGIFGQKWGKRNGPPYPLGENDLSAAERKADTGDIKRVKRDSKGHIIKEDYNSMNDTDLRKTVERMELENRYLRAVDASKGKTFLEKAASTINTTGQILDGIDKTSRFITGESFVKNIAGMFIKDKFLEEAKSMAEEDLTSAVKRLNLEKAFVKAHK